MHSETIREHTLSTQTNTVTINYRFLECDLGQTYPSLFGVTDLEMLQEKMIENETYVYPRLESYFDLCGPHDGPVVEREEFEHKNDSAVWSVLYSDKKKSTKYGDEF